MRNGLLYGWVKDFINNPIFSSVMNDLVVKCVLISLMLVPGFFVLSTGFDIFTTMVKKLDDKELKYTFNKTTLVKAGIVMGAIIVYLPIATVAEYFINQINMLTAPRTEQAETLQGYVEEYHKHGDYFSSKTEIADLEQYIADSAKHNPKVVAFAKRQLEKKEFQKEQTKETLSEEDYVVNANDINLKTKPHDPTWISTIINLIVEALAELFSGLLYLIIAFYSLIMFKLLLAMGPLVLGFYVLTRKEGHLEGWIAETATNGLVFTILNLLLHIIYGVFDEMWKQGALNSAGSIVSHLVIDIAVILAFFKCFRLAALMVGGKGDAGKYASKGLGVTMLAMFAAVKTMGASAAMNSKAIGNILSAQAKGKKDKEE